MMRILLQQKENGLYFKDIESWTRDPAEATDFPSSTAAIDFCAANRISKVHIVLKFPEQPYDIVMPMSRNGDSGQHRRGDAPPRAA